MSNVAIFETDKMPQYFESVNTPDYDGNVDVIINPDISAVDGVPLKYWKRNGTIVEEMTTLEKQEVEDAIAVAKDAMIEKLAMVNAVVLAKALVRTGKITKAELVTAIREVLNNG